ncbi:MAG: hypothetical protein VX640_05015 [Pseudomonadota bacterium]|nr:hypothetical protein [Pseudomonadota bacterium]
MTDIRKEQLALLRFEKKLTTLAASLAAAGVAAKAVDAKLGGADGADAFATLQNTLMTLAQATGEAHAALNAKAIEVGARVLMASGGIPKKEPGEHVASILGIG